LRTVGKLSRTKRVFLEWNPKEEKVIHKKNEPYFLITEKGAKFLEKFKKMKEF